MLKWIESCGITYNGYVKVMNFPQYLQPTNNLQHKYKKMQLTAILHSKNTAKSYLLAKIYPIGRYAALRHKLSLLQN